ncbi:MAG: hypothetical protein HY822_08495 [Acidobacteria bacterium]|nr:hypothetical protein [Acidobacteriota bacterium]
MAPPAWALLERELLRANSLACERFCAKYVDERGYLAHTIRWGTLDGPDDAIETFFNWTLLHALGGSDSLLGMYRKAQDGHYRQYGELRTTLTKLAENGAYYKEFITQSDWFHTGEGMRAFFQYGLSAPNDPVYRERMRRFAGMYMNEDPEALNYDPEKKLIKSFWNGSKGPMLRKATLYDWVGDPVPGSFHLMHSPEGRNRLVEMKPRYPKMLAHCTEYLDSVGDNPLNLSATALALNAYALTGETKYRQWIADYAGAWKERAAACGGNIPTTVGLDGKPGGEFNGQWWKGTYGWNFTIFDGEIEKIAHRNYVWHGSWPGFGNALLATGDASYIDVLRRQMDNVVAAKKVVNGRTLYPAMYGDPRGYKYDGKPEWYQFSEMLPYDRLTEIYLRSMDRQDLERVPKTGWIGYLEGGNADYPEKALESDLAHVRRAMEQVRNDYTSADTRLADYLLGMNPAATDALTNLTLGGYFAGRIWTLHSRFRYFDPERRRAGLAEDVAALVEKLSSGAATVTLVNVNPVDPRTVVVQAGAYGEHHFDAVEADGKTTPVGGPLLTVRLEPGSGTRLTFQMARYKNPPTLAHPWDRPWWPAK